MSLRKVLSGFRNASGAFRRVSGGLGHFQDIFEGFSRELRRLSREFSGDCKKFKGVLGGFEAFQGISEGFIKFQWKPTGFRELQKSLKLGYKVEVKGDKEWLLLGF